MRSKESRTVAWIAASLAFVIAAVLCSVAIFVAPLVLWTKLVLEACVMGVLAFAASMAAL